MNNLLEKVKKIFAALLSVFAMLFSFGTEKIAMDVRVENAPAQTICVEWKNQTGAVIYSPRYSVEKQVDGEWEKVAFAEHFGFNEMATTHYPLQGGSFTIKSEEVFGTVLSPGTYRFNFEYGTADGEKVAVQEFVIYTAPDAELGGIYYEKTDLCSLVFQSSVFAWCFCCSG